MDLHLVLEENKKLKEDIIILTGRLKKYTAPSRNKKFYENHKNEIIQKVKEYNISHDYHYKPTTKTEHRI